MQAEDLGLRGASICSLLAYQPETVSGGLCPGTVINGIDAAIGLCGAVSFGWQDVVVIPL